MSRGVANVAQSRQRVTGVLLLDKPRGMTSQGVVTRVKRLYSAEKAGHTGTLDPAAEGLLPICLGEATKFSNLLLDADKGYWAAVRLGITTTTGDLEGEVQTITDFPARREDVERVLTRFTGVIAQVPPMYSAVRHGGKRLYEIARAGQTVARAPRQVEVKKLDLVALDGHMLQIRLLCSKGTYVRVLAEDIGAALGCGASLAGLRRTRVGEFQIEDAISLAEIEASDGSARLARLLPADALAARLPRVELEAAAAGQLAAGRVVCEPAAVHTQALARVYGPEHRFLGVARIGAGGAIVPHRMMASSSSKTGIA